MIEGHRIGVVSAISYCVGDIVGSGIFVSPTAILRHTGSIGLSLCIWTICAAISLFGALCYIELGTTIRKSGNDFAYLSHFGWHSIAAIFFYVSCILSYPSTLAIQTITLGEYVVAGVGNLIDVDKSNIFFLQRLIGFSVLWPLMILNFFSLRKVAGRFQIIATIAKILVAAIIIITGFYYLIFKGKSSNFSNSFEGSQGKPGEIVLGLYAGLFAYNGWDILNFGSEEVDNPKRTLPIAALSGIFISFCVFLSMNVAYFSVLTVDQFKSSDVVAVLFAQETLGNFYYCVPFLIAILLTGNLNSTIFGCSRYLFAGASRQIIPTMTRCIHPSSNSPRIAIFIITLISIGISFIGDLDNIISYMSFALWTQRTMTQAAFIYFKWTGKLNTKDSFNVPIFVPIVFFCICLALLIIPIWQDFYVAVYGLSLIGIGFFVYLLFIFPNKLPRLFYEIDDSTTVWAQIIFNVMPAPIYKDDDDKIDNQSIEEKKKRLLIDDRSSSISRTSSNTITENIKF